MLLDQIKADMTSALKRGDRVRVETLRYLMAFVGNMAIAKYGALAEASLTDSDVIDCIKKQIKTHKESVEAFEKGGRKDLASTEIAQLAILVAYGPKELSDEELSDIISQVAALGETNFGKLMGLAMARVGGRADGGRVSALLKKKLSV